MYSIYLLVDPISKTIRYVGQTKQSPSIRYNGHKHTSVYKKDKTHKGNWLRTLYSVGLEPIIKTLDKVNTREECDELEKFYIKTFLQIGHKLTNHTEGGLTTKGYSIPKTREWRDKIGKSNKGKVRTEAHKISISLGRKDSFSTKVVYNGLETVYNSFRKACEGTGLDRSTLKRKLVGNTVKYKGFYIEVIAKQNKVVKILGYVK